MGDIGDEFRRHLLEHALHRVDDLVSSAANASAMSWLDSSMVRGRPSSPPRPTARIDSRGTEPLAEPMYF
ncbi:MAG: hypothetical protein VB137_07035 [Burkholderia sp.]